MIKLSKILSEVKQVSKKEIFGKLFNGHPYLLEAISDAINVNQNINEFLKEKGANNIIHYLDLEYGYEDSNDFDINELALYCEAMFSAFKKGEIYVSTGGENSNQLIEIQEYNYCKYEALDEGETIIVFTKENYFS